MGEGARASSHHLIYFSLFCTLYPKSPGATYRFYKKHYQRITENTMTMKTTQAYLKDHPIRIGLFVVAGVLALGVASAFFFGYTSPTPAEAQVTTLPGVTVTATTPVTTVTTPVTTVVTAVITPIVTTVVTTLTGVTVTAERPRDGDIEGGPAIVGPGGVTELPGIVVTAEPPVDDDPFTLPCCTVPTTPVTTPPTVVVPPLVVVPTVVPFVDICINIPGLQNSVPDGMTQDSEGRCLPPLTEVPVCTLIATPTAIQNGGSSTLAWTTDNATSFSIDQGINAVTPVTAGTRSVSPTVTTTYTGTATGPGGTVNCTATVTVTSTSPAPVCTLVANPVAVQLGGSSTLTWTTQNATTFSIDQGIGAVTPTSGGSHLVTPTVTTTYTGTATGPGGTVTCAATVTVTTSPPPTPPICTLVANPSAIQTGGSSTLTWTTQNATTFSIDQGIGAVTPTTGGTRSVTPANTTTYTGTATGPGGTVTCAATVTVTSTPPAAQCVLTASPSSIIKGNTSTLSWSGTNIVSVIIDQGIGSKGPTGTVNVNPERTTTYTGAFTTTAGQTLSCSATVEVTNPDGVCTSNCGGGGGGGGGSRGPRVILSSLKTPGEQPLAFVYLSQIPYTGLDLGPLGTALYWLMLVLWSLAAAYLIFFNALPLAYRKVGAFGGSVKDVLGQPAVVVATHAPEVHAPVHAPVFAPAHVRGHAPVAHQEPAHHALVEAPQSYQEHEGFRSYATGSALTIDDIVKGLAREAEARPTASAHEIRPDFMIASVEQSAPVYPTHEESPVAEAPVALAQPAQETVARVEVPFNEDVRHFIEALLHGDRDTVFGTIRGITRTGGDSEAFLTHAVCALDDAYRSRMDGSVCHPDILSVTADCHPSFLERIVTSLTTAVDGSYSTGITGVKLALTRALAVVNG